MRKLPLAFIAAMLTFSGASAAQAAPRVLATIKPLHSLAAAVMQGVGEPRLMMLATASPHTYALKPSDMQAIRGADVIFWVGPHFESFMAKAMQTVPLTTHAVKLSEAAGVTLLANREGGVWEEEEHEPGHEHDEGEEDMHIWLDPINAKAILTAMSQALGAADPANAARYAANTKTATASIDKLDNELAAELATVQNKPFLVFHDGYQYFEKHYGLTGVGSITVSPDRIPGPRRLSELRKKVADQGALCVFSEPQFTSSLVGTVLSGTKARGGVLDPLGAAAPEGPAGYAGLMRDLANNLKTCLLAAS